MEKDREEVDSSKGSMYVSQREHLWGKEGPWVLELNRASLAFSSSLPEDQSFSSKSPIYILLYLLFTLYYTYFILYLYYYLLYFFSTFKGESLCHDVTF